MIKLIGDTLFQWDTNRKIEVTDDNVQFVEFSIDNIVAYRANVINGEAQIPQNLLEQSSPINAYAIVNENGRQTIKRAVLPVIERAKPEGYVGTVKEWETLTLKFENVENLLYNEGSENQVLTKTPLGTEWEDLPAAPVPVAVFDSVNLNKTQNQVGGLNYSTGAEAAATNRLRTGFIPVSSNEIYSFYSDRDNPQDVQYLFFYDENYGFIEYKSGRTIYNCWVKPKEGVSYIRIMTQAVGTQGYSLPTDDQGTVIADSIVIMVDIGNRTNAFHEKTYEGKEDIYSIKYKNKNIENKVFAASKYRTFKKNSGVVVPNDKFAALLIGDIHGNAPIFRSAIDYLNDMDCIDCGINLGDATSSYPSDNKGDFSWFSTVVNKSNKPFLTVIGNHEGGLRTPSDLKIFNKAEVEASSGTVKCSLYNYDAPLTSESVFNRFIESTKGKIGVPGLNKLYYRKDFNDYGITLIVLHNYDVPDTIDPEDETKFKFYRSENYYSQEQINWFINELKTMDRNNHLVIAMHDSAGVKTTNEQSVWTSDVPSKTPLGCHYPYASTVDIIGDIVNAWKNSTSLEQTYTPTLSGLDSISVDVDFTEDPNGVFVCYLEAHTHYDCKAKNFKYPDQDIVVIAAATDDQANNYPENLPRARGTQSNDCLTVFGVDTDTKKVNLVRVGSYFSPEGKDLSFYSFNYDVREA